MSSGWPKEHDVVLVRGTIVDVFALADERPDGYEVEFVREDGSGDVADVTTDAVLAGLEVVHQRDRFKAALWRIGSLAAQCWAADEWSHEEYGDIATMAEQALLDTRVPLSEGGDRA